MATRFVTWAGQRVSLSYSAGVFADVGGEDFHDRPMIRGSVFGNALESVDAAEANFEFGVAELGDGLGEAVGDLAL